MSSVYESKTTSDLELPKTHKVVRLYPEDKSETRIRVESVDIPRIQDPDDAIVKIILAGLCGSDLHGYRGHEDIRSVIITGHEFVGTVVALGSSFKFSSPNSNNAHSDSRPALYSTLKIGDKVVSPFTSSCAECRFCRLGFTSRCKHQLLFGTEALPGGQAQYVRVPKAGGTLYTIPPSTSLSSTSSPKVSEQEWNNLSNASLLLLADILPTGYFAALQTVQHPKILPFVKRVAFPFGSAVIQNVEMGGVGLTEEDRVVTIAVVGLGPVGLCAIISLLDLLRIHQVSFRLIAIDLNESRRTKVQSIYDSLPPDTQCASHGTFVVSSIDSAPGIVNKWTDGVGCNAVIEAVGNNSALTLAYNLIAPFGLITSVGVHQSPPVPFTGRQLYNKNAAFEFGRCPVRAMFPFAVEVLFRRQDVFAGFVERVVGIEEAPEAYRKFSEGVWGKVVFDPWK